MANLITLKSVRVNFGSDPVLDDVSLTLVSGERVGLIGRNGTGKSTLMKIVAGDMAPEEGEVIRAESVTVARLAQEVPLMDNQCAFEMVAGGLPDQARLLAEYRRVSEALTACGASKALLAQLSVLQNALESSGGWQFKQRIESVLSRMAIPPETQMVHLSGGLKRRVLLARALVCDPDLLLLDEPTNHLDIETILWLEQFLSGFAGTILFVTHDRALLQRLATRIVELDRGRLTTWPGDYAAFLERKQNELAAERRHWAQFDKALAREERWLRSGLKARRTRNQGRVRQLLAMREQRRRRRQHLGNAAFSLTRGEISGKLVAELDGVTFGFGDNTVLRDFSTTILRGDRVAVIGPNGAGKTTLIRLLVGELEPQQGRVRRGTHLNVAYFDQLRNRLDDERSVRWNVADGSDFVTADGGRRHVAGYLKDFLFDSERLHVPVKVLSGGERNRLLMAKLFTQPANLLVLDEPTNDLDIETLEILEERIAQFSGTVLLVSHDRTFIDNIATSVLVFEGDGRVVEYVGGYSDYLRQCPAGAPGTAQEPVSAATAARPTAREPGRSRSPRRSYKEQRELEALPGRIEKYEAELESLQEQMAQPQFYQQPGGVIAQARRRCDELAALIEQAYERWAELDALGR